MMTLYVYRAAGDGKYYVYLAQPILPYRIDATNGNAFERWLRTMGFNQLMYNCLGDPGRSPSPEYSEISAERINNTLTRIIDRFSDVGFPAWSYAQFTQYATENRYDLVPGAHIRTADFSSAFVFNEQMILEIGRPKLFGSLRNYWVDNLRSQAFVDACSSMPRLSDNSISNLQEILEFFSGVVKGEAPELPASLSDLWLGYRYSYSTTKMDVLEAIEFVKRCLDLKSLLPTVTCYGRASLTIDDIDVSCKCRVTVTPRRTAPLDEHYRLLSTLGLTPDLYYLWDSTPFSFIIDWFVPVGDVLAAVDASMLYNGQFYEFKDICYSLSYKRVTDAGPISCYSRWFEDSSPEICPLYWFESSGSVSAKQVLYRALDTNSLFLGGVQIGH